MLDRLQTRLGATRDVRAPADPQDFETGVSRIAPPPSEFVVVAGASSTSISVSDRIGVNGRSPIKSYRVYFLAVPSISLSTAGQRSAAVRMASVVTELPASGKGLTLTANDTQFFGQAGHYFCVSVNQQGAESPVEHVVTV